MKFNIVKVANLVGTGLSVAGMILSAWAGQKSTKETIVKEVAKYVNK